MTSVENGNSESMNEANYSASNITSVMKYAYETNHRELFESSYSYLTENIQCVSNDVWLSHLQELSTAYGYKLIEHSNFLKFPIEKAAASLSTVPDFKRRLKASISWVLSDLESRRKHLRCLFSDKMISVARECAPEMLKGKDEEDFNQHLSLIMEILNLEEVNSEQHKQSEDCIPIEEATSATLDSKKIAPKINVTAKRLISFSNAKALEHHKTEISLCSRLTSVSGGNLFGNKDRRKLSAIDGRKVTDGTSIYDAITKRKRFRISSKRKVTNAVVQDKAGKKDSDLRYISRSASGSWAVRVYCNGGHHVGTFRSLKQAQKARDKALFNMQTYGDSLEYKSRHTEQCVLGNDGYRYVYFMTCTGIWRVMVQKNKDHQYIGTYQSEKEAMDARNRTLREAEARMK